MGLFSRLKQRLTKTRTALSDGLSGLFRDGKAIDQALLEVGGGLRHDAARLDALAIR